MSAIKTTLEYGPIRSLLDSADMSEVMVNSWNKIFVEHKGLLVQTASRFLDARQFQDLVYSILLNDKKDISSSLSFDGTLPEGHRYHITLPPLTPNSPTLTIRKVSKNIFSLDDLIDLQFMCEKSAAFLKSAVKCRLNIVISGGTGSGKTSFLNTLGSLIPENQRVVSVEDTQELQSGHPNWVSMLSQKNITNPITIKECVVNALRMRPDRIIVGECRGPEAFDMLQAMNTGHEGSLTTIHANSAVDCLARIENLSLLGQPEIPLKYLRHQISNAIDLIVQIRRMPSGERKILEILELTGVQGEMITRSNVFEVKKSSPLDVTGYVPQCLSKMQDAGSTLKSKFFDPQTKIKNAV